MEEVFSACFESRLKLDPDLVNIRTRFSKEKEAQRKYLKAAYKLPWAAHGA